MADPVESEPNLLKVANSGTRVVANVTKYLSTLPHPIEIIEELVAVCSVTSSLLNTLDATIERFPSTTQLCPKASFINPLCHDILAAFAQFAQKVSEARKLKVFEPNDVGLVRVPRNAWIFVMGSEAKMGQLRSRLYVEKYRVRVLIDAVTWQGLKGLGPLGRTVEQEKELEMMSKMLPLVAERLMGVWRDYKLRLGDRNEMKPAILPQVPQVQQFQQFQRVHQAQQVQQRKKALAADSREIEDDLKKDVKLAGGKLYIHSSSSNTSIASSCSTCSTSSSTTVIDDSIQERWILRRSEGTRQLTARTYVVGIPFHCTYTYSAAQHYVKPLSSHPSEIEALLTQQTTNGSSVNKDVLNLPDDAQFEIQKLLESRENASSNETIKRSWEVIAFQFRPRRKIAPLTETGSSKWWKRGGTKGPIEWVLAIRGETVDHKARKTPIKYEDPWNPKPKQVVKPFVVTPTPMPTPAPVQQQVMAAQVAPRAVPGAHVLRHVEQRRGLSLEEAEARMKEILGDIFKYEKGETRNDGDETEKV